MIADIMSKKFQDIIKKFFIRCRKLNISLVFIIQSYFSVPTDVRLNSTQCLIMKISNKKELQNIAINHSADIDYNDFVRIYRECTRKPYSLLKNDTALPASDPLRFRKKIFLLIKMIVTNQIKILDNKTKSNQVQHDLGREEAKISALPSKDLLEKYEYLTGEDLGHKPCIFQKAKFEYSLLGMSLNRTFKKDKVKSVSNCKSDFNYDGKHTFYRFYKGYDDFEEMSLDSKYNRMKEFNKLLIDFKPIETKKNSKRSKLPKMLTDFTKSIIMPTKVIMTLMVS